MRVFKPGTTPKPKVPKEPRRRSQIEYHLTCPNCSCEFGVTGDEMDGVMDLTRSGHKPYGSCPHCYQSMLYSGAVRVNSRGEPVHR